MTPSLDAAVAGYVASRHGVLALHEARDLGMSSQQVKDRVNAGLWRRLHRGVYLVGAGPLTPWARYRAATLAVRDSRLSHWSAAAADGLINHQTGPVHVTTTRKVRSRRGIAVHQTRSLTCRRTRHGIPVTTLVRTLDDIRAGEELIRSAERLHGLDRRLLKRQGSTFARGQLIKQLLKIVDDAGLEPPITEYRLLGYEIDAAWPEIRLAVEVDDYATHDNRDAMDADRARDRDLTLHGWRPVRVTSRDLVPKLAEQFAALGVRVASRR